MGLSSKLRERKYRWLVDYGLACLLMDEGYDDKVRKDGRGVERKRYQTKDYMLATVLCLCMINVSVPDN